MDWPVTNRLMYSMLGEDGRLKRGRLVDAAMRGALLMDLAAARMVSERDGALWAGASRTGCSPAAQVLSEIAAVQSSTVQMIVCRGSLSRTQVAEELVTLRRWAVTRGSMLRPGTRYKVVQQLPEPSRTNSSDVIVDLILWLFEAQLDEDDFVEQTSRAADGTAGWVVPSVMAELLDLRSWLAVADAAQGNSGGGS